MWPTEFFYFYFYCHCKSDETQSWLQAPASACTLTELGLSITPPLISYVEFIAWCWCLHSKYVPAELNNYLGWGNKLKALHEEVQFSFPWLCCIFAYHVDAFTVSYQFDILSHQDSQIIWAQSICDRSTPAGRSWYCIYTHLMLLEYIWAVYFHYGSSRG